MIDDFSFLKSLNNKQFQICTGTENYLLVACPGSGKTRTITYRLAYLQKKYPNSRKYNIAITYTNRAATEIEMRLKDMGIDLSVIWTGTIHQFCMNFIIRPYAMYYGDLRKGYYIIDEYTKEQYCKEIAKELGIDAKYKKCQDLLMIEDVKKVYEERLKESKEIDFDMILKISRDLVCNNNFIAENISSLIRSIHVDEYQDTNELQYEILAGIFKANKKINMLFVGDPNQAIYRGLGGVAKSIEELESMFESNFVKEELNGCYRSTQRIVEYYKNFENIKSNVYSKASIKDEIGWISYNRFIDVEELSDEFSKIIIEKLKEGVLEKEICIVAPQWYQIYPIANAMQKCLPNVKFDAPGVSPFKYNPMNPFYILAKLLFTVSGENVQIRKKLAIEFLEILVMEYQVSFNENLDAFFILKIINSVSKFPKGTEHFDNAVKFIMNKLKVEFKNPNKLYKVYLGFMKNTKERIERFNLSDSYSDFCNIFKERDGIVINTIHGIKGEEFNTVIAFDLLNGHLPHWDYIYDSSKQGLRSYETNNLLYVLFSRAKMNLYLYSETGRKTKKGCNYSATDELNSLQFQYD